ncbi:MAG TPA: hypothetical protein VFH73_00950 [Polyangia bacterium]|jgi:sugar phosphate isomerase/epimerase|nr:hypothetical protein [Polyangia bacterium]
MILCGSELRPTTQQGVEPLVRLASESGFAGVAIGRGCLLGDVPLLIAETLRGGFVPGVVRTPMPEKVLGPSKRLPRLGAEAADERGAAIAIARQSLEMAGAAGIGLLWVDFGGVVLGSPAAEFVRLFARRQTGKNQPGTQALPDALAERRARSSQLIDACQWSLEALVAESQRYGVTLAMDLAASPWAVPSPREALELISRFGGARIGTVFDTGKLAVMRRLGLGMAPARVAAVRAAAVLVVENEAVGIEPGYLPGLGEPDTGDDGAGAGEDEVGGAVFGPKERVASAGVPVVIIGASDSSDSEVAAAMRAVARRYA